MATRLESLYEKMNRTEPAKVRTTITMEQPLLSRIDGLARKIGESRSATIALLSELALEAADKNLEVKI